MKTNDIMSTTCLFVALVVAVVVVATVVTAADAHVEFKPKQKQQQPSQNLDSLFSKYSSDGMRMNETELRAFLVHFVDLVRRGPSSSQDHHSRYHDPNHSYSHSHDDDLHHDHDHDDHDHDHDHDHSQHDHSHEPARPKNSTASFMLDKWDSEGSDDDVAAQLKCLKAKVDDLGNKWNSNGAVSAKNHTSTKSSTASHSYIDKSQFADLVTQLVAELDYCLCNASDLSLYRQSNRRRVTQTASSDFDVFKRDNWFFAFLSAFLISVIGLLCYLVVPSLKTYCFNQMFQFLVALAVGSLSGDSLLHLIPHAFIGGTHHAHDHSNDGSGADHSHETHDHTAGVYKGLGAIVGIYVFFVIEKIMQIRRARKEKLHLQYEFEAEMNGTADGGGDLEDQLKCKATVDECEKDKRQERLQNGRILMIDANEHDEMATLADSGLYRGQKLLLGSTGYLRSLSNDDSNKLLSERIMHQDDENDHDSDYDDDDDEDFEAKRAKRNFKRMNHHQNDEMQEQQHVLHANKDLKYISQYLPNNKCDENVDHHDHENEKEHLHKHSKHMRQLPSTLGFLDVSASEPNLKTQNFSSKTSRSAYDQEHHLNEENKSKPILEEDSSTGTKRTTATSGVVSGSGGGCGVGCEDNDSKRPLITPTTTTSTAGGAATKTTPTTTTTQCLCSSSFAPTSTTSGDEMMAITNTTKSSSQQLALLLNSSFNNTNSGGEDKSTIGQQQQHLAASPAVAATDDQATRSCNNSNHNGDLNNNNKKSKNKNNSAIVSHHGHSHINKSMPIHSHGHHHHHHHHYPLHPHSHSHSHHVYKSSREKAHHDHHKMHEKEISDVKLIAWMVIMGDGLHNFADGLAIGASFASSLTTGFGTAIAVLCHELPHEIGDFAVLRRAGVSLRRALIFNAISGIMCMVGVLCGLLIGGFELLTSWSFLFIAGTFLYISLVDMIPELSENKEDDSFKNFFIQSIGILTGVGIMLAIALLEDDIIKIFNS